MQSYTVNGLPYLCKALPFFVKYFSGRARLLLTLYYSVQSAFDLVNFCFKAYCRFHFLRMAFLLLLFYVIWNVNERTKEMGLASSFQKTRVRTCIACNLDVSSFCS